MSRKLLRVLGAAFAIAVTFGGTVGPDILRTPGPIAAQIGNYWLILLLWVLGGVYALLATMSMAEMAVTVPEAGGPYVYPRRVFGPAAGFAIGWSDWIGTCATVAFIARIVGDYASELAPTAVAVSLILLVGAIQWFGIVLSGRVQEAASLAQGVALLALAAACFLMPAAAPAMGAQPARPPAAWFAAAVVAFRYIVINYDGWYTAVYFTEEERRPERLPRAMIQGVLATIGVYLLLNAAFLRVLPVEKLAASPLAAADVAHVVFGARGGRLVTLISVVCTTAVINAIVLTLTRILYGLSRDGLFWSRASEVSAGGTPRVALALSIAASLLLEVTGTFETLVAMASFLFVVNYSSAFLSLLVLRRREPGLPRPWKTPGYPWAPLSVLLAGVAFLVADLVSDPAQSLPALGLLLASYPVYRLVKAFPDSRTT